MNREISVDLRSLLLTNWINFKLVYDLFDHSFIHSKYMYGVSTHVNTVLKWDTNMKAPLFPVFEDHVCSL